MEEVKRIKVYKPADYEPIEDAVLEQENEPVVQMRTIYKGTRNRKGLFTTAVETKRVAAYCRVSTVLEQQALSLETQMSVFRKQIQEHPGWVLAGIYADEGLSGTNTKKRKEFQRMMADCEAGKIDYIITKSISRFARNTLDCLSCVRHLKEIGVYVLFEREKIDTGGEMSEIQLTVLAAFAQEESHTTSDNVRWGIQKRFEKGKQRWCNIYGYRKDAKGKMVIESEEAAIVRRIFQLYERGLSMRDIASTLNVEGIPTPRNNEWTSEAVRNMLKNEKYKGDMLLQKTYVVDHLTHRKVKNDQIAYPSYEVMNHHKGIVSAETYDRVQKIRTMRDKNGGNIPQYPYGEANIRCPLCGAPMVLRNTHGFGNKKVAVGCFTGEGCGQFGLRVVFLNVALIEAYNRITVKMFRELETTDEAKTFLQLKKELPVMETVEFFWLDELVESIELVEHTGKKNWKTKSTVPFWDVIVRWRCGLTDTVPMHLESVFNDPATVAERYWANKAKEAAK